MKVKGRRYYGRNRYSLEEIERRTTKGNWQVAEQIVKTYRVLLKQELLEEIEESRYNAKYRQIEKIALPKYFFKQGEKIKQKMVVRFRYGKEERANKYWKTDKDRVSRICSSGMETLNYILKECEVAEEETKECRHWLNGEDCMYEKFERNKTDRQRRRF